LAPDQLSLLSLDVESATPADGDPPKSKLQQSSTLELNALTAVPRVRIVRLPLWREADGTVCSNVTDENGDGVRA